MFRGMPAGCLELPGFCLGLDKPALGFQPHLLPSELPPSFRELASLMVLDARGKTFGLTGFLGRGRIAGVVLVQAFEAEPEDTGTFIGCLPGLLHEERRGKSIV